MPSLNANRAAKRAREARVALGCGVDGPVPDLLRVVEQRGGAHVVVLALPDGVAGAYVASAGAPLLLVNGRQAVSRQRFTLAHEFGHHRLGHATVVDEQAAISGYLRDPKEVAANAFAAEFLMPRPAVAAWSERDVDGAVTLEHVVRLAADFGVSAQAARYALETARVVVDRRRARQLDDEIADGLHSALFRQLGLAPIQDELADAATRLPRIPAPLRATALGDLLAGDLDVDGLADRLGRDRAEIAEMLAGLGLDRLLPTATA